MGDYMGEKKWMPAVRGLLEQQAMRSVDIERDLSVRFRHAPSARSITAALNGDYAFPQPAEMDRITAEDEKQHLGHFYDSPRHRMQVDFNLYCRDLLKEIERGAKRARVVA